MSSWFSGIVGSGGNPDRNEGGGDSSQSQAAHVPTADEIRRNRLQKLEELEKKAAEAARAAQAAAADLPPSQAPDPAPKTPTKAPSPSLSTYSSSLPPTPSAAPVRVAPAQTPESKLTRTPPKPRDPIEQTVKQVLRVTLSTPDLPSYVYLEELAQQHKHVTLDNLAELLYGRLMLPPEQRKADPKRPPSTFEYLLQTFNAAREAQRNVSRLKVSEQQARDVEKACEEISQLCVNYGGTSLVEESFFPFDPPGVNVEAFKRAALSPGSQAFYEAVCADLAKEPDSLDAVIHPIIKASVATLYQLSPPSILAAFEAEVGLLQGLAKSKAVAASFARIPGFLLVPSLAPTGKSVEVATAFGLILRLSIECSPPDQAILQLFSNIMKRTRQDVEGSLNRLRSRSELLQSMAADLFLSLLRAGGPTKDAVLAWIVQCLQLNQERAKENPNYRIASSDGMMMNLTACLLRLCKPFLGADNPKSSTINSTFLASDCSLWPQDEVRLCQVGERGGTETSSLPAPPPGTPTSAKDFNFISQIFFLTARGIHLGLSASIRKYTRMMRQLGWIQARAAGNEQLQGQFEGLLGYKMVMDAQILADAVLLEALNFVMLSAEVICRICDGPSVLDREKKAFLPHSAVDPSSPSSAILLRIPEHFVEDITDIVLFIARFSPKLLDVVKLESMMNLFLLFLTSPHLVHSPHLRAKMSEVMFEALLPSGEVTDGKPTDGSTQGPSLLISLSLCQQHLAPSLLALYGDVEQTGFHEKLTHRYNIACLLGYLWKQREHREAFLQFSREKEKFVRFANGLMNHINGLVADALSALPDIKSLQEERARGEWATLGEEERGQKESLLQEKEQTVRGSLQLANETIHMLHYLTEEIQQPFLLPELIDRLVSMLNAVLLKLAGPQGIQLKVNNPEDYKFRPRRMLQEIVETILHFTGSKEFKTAIALDGFYDSAIYGRVPSLLRRLSLLPEEKIVQFEALAQEVESIAGDEKREEDELGEIPEEYLDPIMQTLMRRPVRLPSGYVVDEKTILQHLLNDESDPFNRQKLTREMLEPQDKLREEIENWLESKAHK